jgi:hypothetical protein
MKNLIFYARLVKTVSCILIPASIMNLFVKWFFPGIIFSNHFLAGFLHGYLPTESMPLLHRCIAFVVDGCSTSLILIILLLIIQIMNRIEHEEIFSTAIVAQFASISTLAFALALYEPFNRILLSVITTLHNAPGERTLSVSFVLSDLINILMFGFFMVITLLMQRGESLQHEHNLTV